MKKDPNIAPAVCRDCGQPVRIWGDWLYAARNADGTPAVARLWGGYYTHSKDDAGRCLS